MEFPEKLRLWGIGGVGMSALAQHLHRKGHVLSGYDREHSLFTEKLEALGISIDYEPSLARIEEVEGIIYTPAMPKDFPEWQGVERRRLPIWRRAEALSLVVQPYQTLVVAGAHGKTTTAAVLTWLLHALGESPTAFVGGLMRNFDSNYLAGTSPWAVVEGDEYDRAMLLLSPAHAIIQSTDPDHLEIYGSAESVEAAYRTFAEQVKGVVVLGPQVPAMGRFPIRYAVTGYAAEGNQVSFTYIWNGRRREAVWGQIGLHFAENAAAALTLLEAIGYEVSCLLSALEGFRGVARRMELHPAGRHIVLNDYAHHPTEIQRTLEALRQAFPKHRLVALFQPHLYSRTAFFAKEFAQALSLADEVILFPIYAAREPSTPHIGSQIISQHLRVPHQQRLPLTTDMKMLDIFFTYPPSVLAFMGAGDIDRWVLPAVAYLTKGV